MSREGFEPAIASRSRSEALYKLPNYGQC